MDTSGQLWSLLNRKLPHGVGNLLKRDPIFKITTVEIALVLTAYKDMLTVLGAEMESIQVLLLDEILWQK